MNVSMASIIRKVRTWIRPAIAEQHPEVDFLAKIPLIALSEIVAKPIIRVDGSYSYVDGSLPWCDALALLSILVDRSPKSVFEIGTFDGYTTRLMAMNLPEAQIHTIDLPEDFGDGDSGMPKDDWHLISSRRVGAEYRADLSINNVIQHFGDTAEYDFPIAEFFFIDGAHTYAYARNDTEKAMKVPGAKTLVWHDCNETHPDVNRWLVEMIQSGYPVRRVEGTNVAFLDIR
jgi:hypothetical protein